MADEEVLAAEPEIIDLLSDNDRSFRVGDEWEGKASDFRKSWIPQSELTSMREKDKSEIERQVASQLDREKAQFFAQQQAQALQRVQQQPAPQGNGFQGTLSAIYDAAKAEHGGYIHADQLQELVNKLVGAVNAEFGARDRMTNQFGSRLDEWYSDSQQRAGTLKTLAETHADRTWNKFIDGLETDFSDLPRSAIEALASGYEASPGDTPDQLKDGIGSALKEHVQAMNAHREKARAASRQQAAQLAKVGMPGVAAAAVPAAPDKPLQTADEITDHFWPGSDSAS